MIRIATIEDSAIVTHLALKLWPDHQFEQLQEELESVLSDNNSFIALYFDDCSSIGFAQCQLRNDYVEGTKTSPVGYLEGIFVEANYRGQGMAKKLLQYCETFAKEKGFEEFASDCELSNTDSLNFHLKVGFSEANRVICFTKRL